MCTIERNVLAWAVSTELIRVVFELSLLPLPICDLASEGGSSTRPLILVLANNLIFPSSLALILACTFHFHWHGRVFAVVLGGIDRLRLCQFLLYGEFASVLLVVHCTCIIGLGIVCACCDVDLHIIFIVFKHKRFAPLAITYVFGF